MKKGMSTLTRPYCPSLNTVLTFVAFWRNSVSRLVFRSLAANSMVSPKYWGKFFRTVLLKGKYGESVSNNKRLIGTCLTASICGQSKVRISPEKLK